MDPTIPVRWIIPTSHSQVTRPSPAMLHAMMAAPVGDDVWGDDPTVNQLQHVAATMFGKEAAIFCPSGTMTNQSEPLFPKCSSAPLNKPG